MTTDADKADVTLPNSPAGDPVGYNSDDKRVSYSSFQKVLGEKKRLSDKHSDALAELAVYKSKDQEQAEKALIEEKKFDEVLSEKQREIDETRGLLDQSTKRLVDTHKLTSFLQGLGSSKLESKYYGLVDLEKINLDNEGQIDHDSLNNCVNEFKTEHTRLLINPRTDLPQNHTGGKGKKGLTVSEWKSLKSSKEMRERSNEVDWDSEDK